MNVLTAVLTITILLIFTGMGSSGYSIAEQPPSIFDRPANHVNTVFHVGFWVTDIDEMLNFLALTMNYNIAMRSSRDDGGERAILVDSRGQYIELLSDPNNVENKPDYALHPVGRVAGTAHVSLWSKNLPELEKN